MDNSDEVAKPNGRPGSGHRVSLGSDMRAAYTAERRLTGTGQKSGSFELAGSDLADLATYYSNIGQRALHPHSCVHGGTARALPR